MYSKVYFFFVVFFVTKNFVECLQNPYCGLSCDYGSQTILHTVCEREPMKCGPAPKCGPDFKVIDFDDATRQMLLDLHNELRNKVASGHELRDRQPSASNMKVLNYDKELEFLAQCWANACNGNPLHHDICRGTRKHSHVGQNLAFFNSSTSNINLKKVMKQLAMYWYDEVGIFKSRWVRNTQDRGPSVKVGHYTQMLWADTDTIGCAMSYYTVPRGVDQKWHNYILVCNYGPGGNYIGAPVYQMGKPCSKCGEQEPCNDKYRALCGKSKSIRSGDFSPFAF